MDIKNKILEIDDKGKITGEIYLITNEENNKCYVGQVKSHRLNKNKYRPFGYIGRFNDHISEAINNTKEKQCTYLNNAIRKYGKEKFKVILLENCSVCDIDEREQYYITLKNTLFPNGYNLTKGGKSFYSNIVKNNSELNIPKKRGRDFGYTHKKETIEKMKERLTDKKLLEAKTIHMRNIMRQYYDNNKIKILSEYDLDDDVTKYIKPVVKKNSDEIHDYIIRINKRKLTVTTENESLDEKYNRLLNILNKAKNKSLEKENNKIVKVSKIPKKVIKK